MHDALSNFTVEYAGEYAGYREPGEIIIRNDRILITRAVRLIEPKEGDCEFLKKFIRRTFTRFHTVVDDGGRETEIYQFDAVFGWLQGALRTLYEAKPGKWRHGQALVLLGDSGIGKTSLQHLFTTAFGGRATDPELFFKDRTSFNEQMGEREHWMMSDPKNKNRAEQEKFLGDIKKYVANVWMPHHPKGAKQTDIPTFRRMSISLNTDYSGMKILQDMSESDLDKVILVNFEHAGPFKPDGQEWGSLSWEDWEEKTTAQLPAFLYWIFNEYEVPAPLRHVRYNVVYRNPEVEPELAAPSAPDQDRKDQDIVHRALGITIINGRELSAGQLFDIIYKFDSDVRERAKTSENFASSKTVLKMLQRWWRRYSDDTKDPWAVFIGFKMQQVHYKTNGAYFFKFKSV